VIGQRAGICPELRTIPALCSVTLTGRSITLSPMAVNYPNCLTKNVLKTVSLPQLKKYLKQLWFMVVS
ncbi:hypothetical protein, partial [Candidatus Hakubella thermalkaliphila]|uniref:hypothetical protein n=1 Tax=Candidatus Hakubella thermalkaliphila TaxID=2754717 RepID=UPI001C611B16